jgi:hypothetical protein
MIDDLHVADSGSLDTVRHLAHGIGDVPVLLLVALRSALSRDSADDLVGVALAEGRAGSPDECVLDLVAGDRWHEPLSNERTGDFDGAEETLAQATARLTSVGAAAPLLRVATARAVILDEQGRRESARAILAPAVGAVRPGWDTPVVQQARAALDRLTGDPETEEGRSAAAGASPHPERTNALR